jgi:hypothetical protein
VLLNGSRDSKFATQLFGKRSFQPLANVWRQRQRLSVAVDFDRFATRIDNDAAIFATLEVH